MKTLVGIRPTGKLHLGHYFSVIKPALEEQADVLIAQYHAPGQNYDQLVEDLDRYGVKPSKIKVQSLDPEKYFRLLELASFGELSRMTQFKDKKQANAHLFIYPVLMAHDVIGYDKVIVGDDQKQHLEFARRLLKKAGLKYPEGDYRGGRVMSLTDPTKKMSKSDPKGCLFLDDDFDKKLQKAVTTPEGIKNLKYIASQFGVKWDNKNNQDSKTRLARVLEGVFK